MGVIHKLKKEVIDYILASKHNNQKLSCRKLAQVASEKFDMKISKSSVNNILKDASLSNSVGRPAQKEPQQKFKIPAHKKKEISESLSQSGLGMHSFEKELKTSPENHDTLLKSKSNEKINIEESLLPHGQIVLNKEEAKEKFLQNNEKEIKNKARIKVINKENIVDNMGVVFLKAALMEFATENILSQILDDEPNSRAYDLLVCAEILNKNNEEFLCSQQAHGLYVLNGLDGESHKDKIMKCLQIIRNDKIPQLQYLKELQQQAVIIGGFGLHFNDGRSFVLDAATFALGGRELDQKDGLTISNAIRILSRFLISNVENIPLCLFQTSEESAKKMYSFMNALDFLENQRLLSKISLLGLDGREVANFEAIPRMPRNFVCGMPSDQDFLVKKAIKFAAKTAYMDVFLQQEYMISDTKLFSEDSPYFHNNMRIIRLYSEDNDIPRKILLTNVFNKSAEDIVDNFLLFWPCFMERKAITQSDVSLGSVERDNAGSFKEGQLVFTHFAETVFQISNSQYFSGKYSKNNISCFMSDICNIRGIVQKEAKREIVSLLVGESNKMVTDCLKVAINRINQRPLYNRNGSKLLIRLNFD